MPLPSRGGPFASGLAEPRIPPPPSPRGYWPPFPPLGGPSGYPRASPLPSVESLPDPRDTLQHGHGNRGTGPHAEASRVGARVPCLPWQTTLRRPPKFASPPAFTKPSSSHPPLI